MSKRNFILFAIVLVIIIATVFGFLYIYQPQDQSGETQGINFLADFLPFGKGQNTTPVDTNTPVDISGYIPEPETNIQNAKLIKVSSFPIAGYGVFTKERFKSVFIPEPIETLENTTTETKPTPPSTEFIPALRYVNKATGNIYQTFVDKIDERRFSSTTIPKVYEAFLGNGGESVVMRYLKSDDKTIETFIGNLPKEFLGADLSGTNEIKGSFLPENISDISISPDNSKIFYIFNIGENAVGITLTLANNTKTQIFDSPFTEWLSFWPNNRMITVTTKPSAGIPGYMYAINPEKKDFNKILGEINGLTTLTSPDGKIVLYGDNNLSLNTFNIETGDSNTLGIKTLPEKCVWTSTNTIIYCAVPRFIDRAQYPDSWYQGETSFSDQIWKIDIESGNTIKISDPISVSGGEEIDGIRLNLDKDENYLFFVNKKDSYLWGLELK